MYVFLQPCETHTVSKTKAKRKRVVEAQQKGSGCILKTVAPRNGGPNNRGKSGHGGGIHQILKRGVCGVERKNTCDMALIICLTHPFVETHTGGRRPLWVSYANTHEDFLTFTLS